MDDTDTIVSPRRPEAAAGEGDGDEQSGNGRWPASAAQQWVAQAARAAVGVDRGLVMGIVVRVRGPLDLDLLDRAYDELVARHEVLRTRLEVEKNGTAWQQVEPHQTVTLLRSAEPVSDDEEAGVIGEWASRPIPFGEPPAVRGFVAERGPEHHLVGLTFDHTTVDPRSLTIAAGDLAAIYTAGLAGQEVAPLPMSYGQYAAWQQERLAARRKEDRRAWNTALKGLLPPRYRRDHPFVRGVPPAGHELRVPLLTAEELRAVDRWSWRQRATTFCALLAAFARTCANHTEARDLPIPTVFEQRDHPDARDLIGPFVHGTLLRVTVEDGEPWDRFVGRVRDMVTATYARAHLPIVEVVMRAPRLVPATRGAEPTWCRAFQYLPLDLEATLAFGEATGEVVQTSGPGPSRLDYGLNVWAHRTPDGALDARVVYDGTELSEASARAMMDELADTVRAMVA